MTSANMNVIALRIIENMIIGLYILDDDIPQLLIANSSLELDRFPRTIEEAARVANGNVYTKNCGINNKTI